MNARALPVVAVALLCLAACAAGASGDIVLPDDVLGDGGVVPLPATSARDGSPTPISPPPSDASVTDGPEPAETGTGDALADAAPDTAPPPPDAGGIAVVVAPSAPGSKITLGVELPLAPKLARLTVNSCRGTSLRLGPATSYAYIEARNDGPRDKVVSVWTSRAPGGAAVDTIVAAYAGSTPPATDSERLACSVGVEQGCSARGGDATACVVETGGLDWAGLMSGDGRGVTVPAMGSVVIYVAAYDALAAGPLTLSVRTDQIL